MHGPYGAPKLFPEVYEDKIRFSKFCILVAWGPVFPKKASFQPPLSEDDLLVLGIDLLAPANFRLVPGSFGRGYSLEHVG